MSKRESIQKMEMKNLSFQFESGERIFENFSFDIPQTKAIWVRSAGPRGKSTLLKILAGLLSPQSGSYLINGQDVSEMNFEEFLKYRLSMGYGFDSGGLLNNRTLYENLSLPLLYHKLLPTKEAHHRVDEMMNFFGLDRSRHARPFFVSGSQRKLACLVRPFVHWPEVVFLDDPVTGLKQENLKAFFHFVEEGFETRGLKQLIFTGESPLLAGHLKADELFIGDEGAVFTAAA